MCSYHGEKCDISCPGLLTDNMVMECNGNGVCEEFDGSFHCVCASPLFSGEACEAKCPGTSVDGGAVIMCNGHGTCNDDRCVCSTGYYGEDCNQSCPGLIEDAETLECNGNGVCNPSTFKCECINDTFKSPDCPCAPSLSPRCLHSLLMLSRHLRRPRSVRVSERFHRSHLQPSLRQQRHLQRSRDLQQVSFLLFSSPAPMHVIASSASSEPTATTPARTTPTVTPTATARATAAVSATTVSTAPIVPFAREIPRQPFHCCW